ncbi:hypothetical protein [Lucifera butyrica]|nr:hypothetical protein [Lucifera butyrica]
MFLNGGCCGGGNDFPPRYHEDRHNNEREVLLEEIRKLYARGMISQTQYWNAMEQLNRGRFTLDDLWELRNGGKIEQTLPPRNDERPKNDSPAMSSDIQSQLQFLEQKKQEVFKAKEEVAKLMEGINQSVKKLKEEMAFDEQMAKQLVESDEAQARAYLKQRQETGTQMATMEVRLEQLNEDMKQMEQMETRLNAKALELKALGQRELLAKLEGDIKNI